MGFQFIKLPFLILIMVWSLSAAAAATMTYSISGKLTPFIYVGKLLVSSGCESAPKIKCDALKRADTASTSGLNTENGANPGALLCIAAHGAVVIGKDERRNERSFCRFDDRSMIASDSLFQQAIENDLNKLRQGRSAQ